MHHNGKPERLASDPGLVVTTFPDEASGGMRLNGDRPCRGACAGRTSGPEEGIGSKRDRRPLGRNHGAEPHACGCVTTAVSLSGRGAAGSEVGVALNYRQ